MKTKDLIRLGVVAVVALGAALWIGAAREPSNSLSGAKVLAPGLKDSINKVTAVRLVGAESKPIATLTKSENGWTIAERGGFAADAAKVRELLLKLADASLLEAKTSSPDLYKKLAVEDTATKGAGGVLVEIDVEGAKAPQKLIIGRFNGQGGEGTFVRRADEAQSWLAKGNLTLEKNTGDWLRHDLTDIPSSRIASAQIAYKGKTLKVFKNAEGDANFQVADVPKGREVNSEFAGNGLGSVLAGMKLEDIKAAADAPPSEDARELRYSTFDGITVNGKAWDVEGKNYVQLAATLDEAVAQESIERAQAKEAAEFKDKLAAAEKADAAKDDAKNDDAKNDDAKKDDAKKDDAKKDDAKKDDAKNALKKPDAPLSLTDKAKDAEQRVEKLRKEVAALNARFQGWSFAIPAFKYSNLNRSIEDLLKPLPDVAGKPKPGGIVLPPGSNPAPVQ